MSNFNTKGFNVGEKVSINVTKTEGVIVDLGVDSALVKTTLKIDSQDKSVNQWYKNEVLTKIKAEYVDVTEVVPEVLEKEEIETKKTLEFGIIPEERKVKNSKKKSGGKKQ